MANRAIVIVSSYHHHNTKRIAAAMAGVLDAPIRAPQQVDPSELREYDLVGFGSGVYSARHHPSLLDLAGRLSWSKNRDAFLFSTTGTPAAAITDNFIRKNHSALREMLESKGYRIVGEFGCAGFNTNSFLKVFGGLNRGRPDAGDIERAERFAWNLIRHSVVRASP